MSLEPERLDQDIEVRDHLSSGLNRSQFDRELRRGLRPALLVMGLVLLSGLTLFLLARNTSGGRSPLAGSHELRVAVDDASGVVPGVQEVRISGMRVGRITNSKISDGRAVLTAKIDEKFGDIYRDARLRLRPSTPLNDLFLDVVDRGTPKAGTAGAAQILPATATSVPVQFSQALNVFRPVTRARMQRFIAQFGPALRDNGDELRAVFVQLTPFLRAARRLTSELATRRQATRRLVRNLNLTLQELGARDRSLKGLINHGARTLTALGDNRDPLNRTLARLPGVITQARSTFSTLTPTLQRSRQAFDALEPVADVLPSAMRSLEDFSQDARPALAALQPSVRTLSPLFEQARPLSRTLASAFSALRPSVPRLDSITRQIAPCEMALQQFFMDTLSVFKFQSQKNAIPRGELVANAPGQLTAPPSCAQGRPRK